MPAIETSYQIGYVLPLDANIGHDNVIADRKRCWNDEQP
jgi:hypothetical protein